jgi:hypothetical protein
MLEWYAHVVHGSERRLGPFGRGLVDVLEPDEVERVHGTLLKSSVEEAWRALFETTGLFREVSTSVATRLGFPGDGGLAEEVDERLRDVRRSRLHEVEE